MSREVRQRTIDLRMLRFHLQLQLLYALLELRHFQAQLVVCVYPVLTLCCSPPLLLFQLLSDLLKLLLCLCAVVQLRLQALGFAVQILLQLLDGGLLLLLRAERGSRTQQPSAKSIAYGMALAVPVFRGSDPEPGRCALRFFRGELQRAVQCLCSVTGCSSTRM